MNSSQERRAACRRVAGNGGKAAHVAVKFKPLRKPVTTTAPVKRKNVVLECVDLGDDDDEDVNKEEEDDECQILDVDVDDNMDEDLEELASESFCDLCGLYLETIKDLDTHHQTVHKIIFCKWCDKRITISKFKKHILSQCSMFKQIRSSHCSIHNTMETEEDLGEDETRGCRPWCCDLCDQRYDKISLTIPADTKNAFICPGCIHGKVFSLSDKRSSASKTIEEVQLEADAEKHVEIEEVDLEDSEPVREKQAEGDIVGDKSSEIEEVNLDDEDETVQEVVFSEKDQSTEEAASIEEVELEESDPIQNDDIMSIQITEVFTTTDDQMMDEETDDQESQSQEEDPIQDVEMDSDQPEIITI